MFKSLIKKEMPNPTELDLKSDEFNAIWDISAPDYYNGYCGANGSHVKLLLDALKPVLRNKKIDDIIS